MLARGAPRKARCFPMPVSFGALVTHILEIDKLPDRIDLAKLRAVRRATRDAVIVTGRQTKKPF
jgi:hypothetical protein